MDFGIKLNQLISSLKLNKLKSNRENLSKLNKSKKLFNRLLVTYLVIILLSLISIGGFALFALKTKSQNNLIQYLSLEAHHISSSLEEDNFTLSEETAKHLSTKGFHVSIFDKNGKRKYSSVNNKLFRLLPNNIQKKFIQAAYKGMSQGYEYFDQNTKVNWYFLAIPHFSKDTIQNDKVTGVVQVGLPIDRWNQDLADSFFTFLCLGTLILTVAIFSVFGLAHWITNPIQSIGLQAKQIAETRDLTLELPVSGFEEVAELTKSFNSMIHALRDEKVFQRKFIADASHELKTPVTAITVALDVLEMNKSQDEGQKEAFLKIINRQIIRLRELITDLLDISVLENGRGELNLSQFEVLGFVENCVKDIEPIALKGNLDFSWFVQNNIEILADKAKLHRAIINLLTNAIKHTPAKGEIFLSVLVEKESNELIFSIQDTGEGIKKEDLDKIFGRFYRSQLDRSRNSGGGSGLGLAIVKQIIDLHSGRIVVMSEYGEGSEFQVRFDISKISSKATIHKSTSK